MSYLGDRHNFGRATKLVNGRFHKPRPIYWEWLFFGVDSPLKNHLPAAFHNLFKLRVLDHQTPHSGLVEPLSGIPLDQDSALHVQAQNYAPLAAYSLFFGISDLHVHNLFVTPDGVAVPIDVECVFMPMELANETALFPHRNVPSHLCFWNIWRGDKLDLMASFVRSFQELIAVRGTISKCLLSLKGLTEVPVRIIQRPTGEYLGYLGSAQQPTMAFRESEQVQLDRGDVPYFFCTLGEPLIRLYTTPDWQSSVVPELADGELLKTIAGLSALLDERRLLKTFIQSLLWMGSRLVSEDFSLAGAVSVTRRGSNIEVSIDGQTYRASN